MFDKLKMLGYNVMTLYVYLLGPKICKIVARARMQTQSKLAVAEPGQK